MFLPRDPRDERVLHAQRNRRPAARSVPGRIPPRRPASRVRRAIGRSMVRVGSRLAAETGPASLRPR